MSLLLLFPVAGTPGAITGELSRSLDAATLLSTGNLSIGGVSTQTLGGLIASGTGRLEVVGTTTRTLDDATLAATGKLSIVGATAQTLDAVTLISAGTVSGAEIVGEVNVTLASLACAGTATIANAVIAPTVGGVGGVVYFPRAKARRRAAFGGTLGNCSLVAAATLWDADDDEAVALLLAG